MKRKLIQSLDELQAHLPSWYGRPFSFDIETSDLSHRRGRLLGMALTFPIPAAERTTKAELESYYVVIEHTVELWDGTAKAHEFIPRAAFVSTLRSLFAQHDVVMVAHNSKFEMSWMSALGLRIEGRLFDTLLAAQLIDENRDKGLKDLAVLVSEEMTRFEELPRYKGYTRHQFLGVPLAAGAQYAMHDTEVTWKLYLKFREQLETEGVSDAFYNLWMPLLPVLHTMEARGVALNLEKVRAIREEYLESAERNERIVRRQGVQMLMDRYGQAPALDAIPKYYLRFATEDELGAAFEGQDGATLTMIEDVPVPILTKASRAFKPRVLDFNTGSSQQMKDLIFGYLGVKAPDGVNLKLSANTGEVSLDKDNLNTLLFYNEQPPEALTAVLEWRKATKFIGTYLDRFLADADPDDFNAIHTNFNQDGTNTGRLSSSQPNLLNIPSRGEVGKQARSMFVARPGYDLIVSDLGQAELRLLAHYSQDQALLRAFEEGQDLHILTGAAFARLSYAELYERCEADDFEAKQLRYLGKTGNFSLAYGMGAVKFQRYLLVNNKYEVSVPQAQEWIDGYNAMYAGATAWKQKVVAYARRHGHVLTIKRRKRRLPAITSSQRGFRARAERQAINATIQGSVGDIIAESMLHIQPLLASFGGSILLQCYDEILAEAPEQYSETCARTIELLMVQQANQYLRCPLVAEASIGKNWGVK